MAKHGGLSARWIRWVEGRSPEEKARVLTEFLGMGATNRAMEKEIFGIADERGWAPWRIYRYYGFDGADQGSYRDRCDELETLVSSLLGSQTISHIQGLKADLQEGKIRTEEELKAAIAGLSTKSVTEKTTQHHTRVHQDTLRDILLDLYGGCCALCQVTVESLLRASHIVPWAKDPKARLDPSNAVLLCLTHDGLFDSGYISFDDEYNLLVSPKLDMVKNNALHALVQPRKLTMPKLATPNPAYLLRHRTEIFKA